jgi:hypothetical protein
LKNHFKHDDAYDKKADYKNRYCYIFDHTSVTLNPTPAEFSERKYIQYKPEINYEHIMISNTFWYNKASKLDNNTEYFPGINYKRFYYYQKLNSLFKKVLAAPYCDYKPSASYITIMQNLNKQTQAGRVPSNLYFLLDHAELVTDIATHGKTCTINNLLVVDLLITQFMAKMINEYTTKDSREHENFDVESIDSDFVGTYNLNRDDYFTAQARRFKSDIIKSISHHHKTLSKDTINLLQKRSFINGPFN